MNSGIAAPVAPGKIAEAHPQVQAYWQALDCGFKPVEDVFEECVLEALSTFSREQMSAYIDAARVLGKLGRGPEPILAFLEKWPSVVSALVGKNEREGSGNASDTDGAEGEDFLSAVMKFIGTLQKSPNARAITPFLQTLAAVARRLQSAAQMQFYIGIAHDLMVRTTGSIHGHHTTFHSPGLPEFFLQAPLLTERLSIAGIRNWVEYGIRHYDNHPGRQIEYFKLESADSRAVLQRERHGILFADVERPLDLYLRALWHDTDVLVPYSTAFDDLRKPIPYYDAQGMRVPDVLDDRGGVSGLDRYRAILAHMIGHRRYSSVQIADNWSPFQRMAVEFFEDGRIEHLLIAEYPGLSGIFLALHPKPLEGACDPATTSCLRHRLALLSRALIDPAHGYTDADLLDYVKRFHALLADGQSSTDEMASLALSYVAKTRRQSDQLANVHFDDTVIDYRDDNRHLWRFIEDDDEGEVVEKKRITDNSEELKSLPPRHYPEWDYLTQTYRPDWVSLYEGLHPSVNPALVDRLLEKHDALAKRLKRLLDLLKPQNKVRLRYQEEGSDLDLDVAIRALIDFKGGAAPDPRVNMSHRTDGRNIAVMVLLDLSESLNEKVGGASSAGAQTLLELSQEAVSLLAWAIDCLGDPCAIAGFHSNTRHEVRFQHIKGFSERWDEAVKGRVAAMQAGFSTRMGAALRHAGHHLANRQADKRILLLLTDGAPADIDVSDAQYLRADAKRAVDELSAQGLTTFCLSLDPQADDYVREIFGQRWRVLDRVEQLPEQLPALYLQLTR